MLLVKLYLRLGKTAALLSTYGGIKKFSNAEGFRKHVYLHKHLHTLILNTYMNFH